MTVRPLRDRGEAPALAAAPSPPSLAERLEEARRAVEGPSRRVAELEAAKTAALAAEDGAALDLANAELPAAREELAIATVTVTALEHALADESKRRAADEQAAHQLRAREQARRRIGEATRLEAEALAELDAEVEALRAGLRAIRLTFQRGQQLEQQAGQARAEVHQARVTLGEAEPVMYGSWAANRMSSLIDQHPGLQAILKCDL